MRLIFSPRKLVFTVLATVLFTRSFTTGELDTNEIDSEDFINLSAFGGNAFVKPGTEKTGTLVANYKEDSDQNPEELGLYFEGDILMPTHLDVKNALVRKKFRWPKNVVPYVIHGNFTEKELKTIQSGFDEYHQKTCIRFKPQSIEKDYISISNGKSGCWSAVGRIGGMQELNLQTPACLIRKRTIVHELMHAVGFMHEHTRHDRDKYITVRKENIKSDQIEAFKIIPKNIAHHMGFGYDYSSIVHYSPTAFSKNGQATIEPKFDTDAAKLMGRRGKFSDTDVAKINAIYKC